MRTKELNEEVLFADDRIVEVRREDVDVLRQRAEANQRKRIRLCGHPNVDDNLHEMFIVQQKDTYVRPHKHLNKGESLHVIEGSVDVVVFDEEGNVVRVCSLGDYSSGRPFYHRIGEPLYHTLLVSSDTLVFHETTAGPFRPEDTTWAPWAPAASDGTGQVAYLERLSRGVTEFLTRKQDVASDSLPGATG